MKIAKNNPFTGGTLFSGIGTPELSAPWIDWRWSTEIDPFANAVLTSRFPYVLNLGDVMEVNWDAVEPVDIIVFGSPCQSFSVAGKRAGLDDPRGNLALIGLQVIDRLRPRWMVFENVPGLLSSDESRDFGTFLASLGECGYGFAYRVLDAQYFGVPQRRRRVFVVGYLGDWRPPAAVLFEPESLRGDSPPSREKGEDIAGSISSRATAAAGGGFGTDSECDGGLIARAVKASDMGHRHDPSTDNYVCGPLSANGGTERKHGYGMGSQDYESGYAIVADTLRSHPRPSSNSLGNIAYGGNNTAGPIDLASACNAKGGSQRMDFETETFVTHSLRAEGFDASEDGTGRGTPLVMAHAVAFDWQGAGKQSRLGDDVNGTGTLGATKTPAIAFTERTRAEGRNFEAQEDIAYALCNPGSGGRTHSRQLRDTRMMVRRLTPRECERLQGFPDDFTAIRYNNKSAKDGPRYRALGNAMAVPVIGWILRRICEFGDSSDTS